AEGGAGVQAKRAVDAGGHVVVGRGVWALEGGGVADVQRHGQMTYLPGEIVRAGSNASRTRRIQSAVAGGVPQAPTSRFSSTGAASSTSEPLAASAARRAARTASTVRSPVQWATPTPGDAHHRAPAGSARTSSGRRAGG